YLGRVNGRNGTYWQGSSWITIGLPISALAAGKTGKTMAEIQRRQIQHQLKRLSNARVALFGADVHRFSLNPPLTEREVLAFEKLHNILLPSEYHYFIRYIGNGGAGPYYGVFPLGQMDGTGERFNSWREKDGFVGVLSEPFPLRDAWNDL